MKPEEIRAWQHYFASHELKQPFEQVWEPVYDPKSIAPDRYKGILIPYYRFVDQPSIYAQESNRHTEVTISFAGCDATVRRDSIPSLPYEKVSMDDLFEVEEIQYEKKTRGGKLYTCPECHAKLDLSETFDEDDYLFVHSIETVEVE